MTTMTDNTTETGQAGDDTPNEVNEPQVGNTVDASASEKLRNECGGCRLSISGHWPRGNKGIDAKTKAEMSQVAGMDDKALSASKRLYDSKHPTVKKANELANRIHSYWKSMTIELAQAYCIEPQLEGGTRLIRRDQIQEFHDRMVALKSEAETVQEEMNRERDSILESSRAMLTNEQTGKTKFNADDYPQEFLLVFRWSFPNVDIPAYLEELAPEVYAQEMDAVRKRFEDSFELANVTMLSEMEKVFAAWVDRLGPVIRVYPPDHAPAEYHIWRNAELLERIYPADDETLTSGQIKVKLRRKIGQGRKTETKVIGPFPETYFNDIFKPSGSMSERKTLHKSTIENLTDMVAKFGRLGSTISTSGEFNAVMKKIEDHLSQCSDVNALDHELRNSQVFRQRTHELASQLQGRISSEIKTFKKHRRVTRQS